MTYSRSTTLALLSVWLKDTHSFQILQTPTVQSPSPLFATVFFGDEEHTESDLYDDLDAREETTPLVPDSLHSPAWTGAFARLVSANQPGLNVEDIERVSIANFEGKLIELEAVLCENQGCVSVNVPVELPRQCDVDSIEFEQCIQHNLEELDAKLEEATATQLFLSPEEEEAQKRLQVELHRTDNISFPDWWVFPKTNLDLSKCCDRFLGILNETDFQPDLIKLFEGNVKQVAVVAVGPAGLVLRTVDEHYNLRDFSIGFEKIVDSEETLSGAILKVVEE